MKTRAPKSPAERHAKEIVKFRLRMAAVLAARRCVQGSFVWVMVWAAVGLGLRVAFRVETSQLWWGLLGLAAAAAVGVYWGIRQTPSPAMVRAALDSRGGLGGLLMAEGDGEIGDWDARIEQVPQPAIRWQSSRPWKLLAMGTAFLTAVFLMPDAYLPAAGESALDIGGEMQKLTEKMEVLKQEQILPPEKVNVLEKELEQLRQEASGNDPAKTLESLDHLEQSFSKAAAEAAESAIKDTEKANQAQELAQALDGIVGQLDSSQLGDAMKQLAQMAEQAAAENSSLAENLSDALKDALKNASQKGNLSESQLNELAEALKNCQAGQCNKIGRMVQAKLIDAALLEACRRAGQCDSAELAAMLSQCKNGKQLADAIACLRDGAGLPGRGGVSRGRADAAMTWSQGTEKGDAEFKEKVLPPAAAASLKDSQTVAVSAADPTAKAPAGGSTGGVLEGAKAGGGEARTQIILPEHRQSVQRYFERGRK